MDGGKVDIGLGVPNKLIYLVIVTALSSTYCLLDTVLNHNCILLMRSSLCYTIWVRQDASSQTARLEPLLFSTSIYMEP